MKGSKYKLAKSVNIKYGMCCRAGALAIRGCAFKPLCASNCSACGGNSPGEEGPRSEAGDRILCKLACPSAIYPRMPARGRQDEMSSVLEREPPPSSLVTGTRGQESTSHVTWQRVSWSRESIKGIVFASFKTGITTERSMNASLKSRLNALARESMPGMAGSLWARKEVAWCVPA